MTSTISKDQQPLPLADILRDLALLRASDIDMAVVLPDYNDATKRDADVDTSVQRSYEFVKEARAALRIQNRGDLGSVGESVERVREGLEEILKGLEGSS